MMSMSSLRGPQRCSLARSRPKARSTSCTRFSKSCGFSVVSSAAQQLMNGGWSSTPQGGGRYEGERLISFAPGPVQSITKASRNLARTSPTSPPGAVNASAIAPTRALPLANDGNADIGESGGDRGVRLVHRHTHRSDRRKRDEHGFGDRAGGGFDQAVAPHTERAAGDVDDLIVTNRVG